MSSPRQLFLRHLAQTSGYPLMIEINKARGIYLYDKHNRKYIDLISGIAVNNIGHCHPRVITGIKKQAEKYLHLMVYGEYILSPQYEYAKLLTDYLPESLNCVFFVNSGSEAVDGAMKLAKRYTGRQEIIAFYNSYHGSTHGALSVLGDENFKYPFRPLLPGIRFINFNNTNDLQYINEHTACVITEPIQSEAGIILPANDFLINLRKRCTETGALLVFDEVQTGFGRTGTLFAFEQYNVVPDILVIAKGMGGGMPLGAFIADKNIMNCLKKEPMFGHITTFGGHPVSCAAAIASLQVLKKEKIIESVQYKEQLFRKHLVYKAIKNFRGKGLLLAIEFKNKRIAKRVISEAMKNRLIVGNFLFVDDCIALKPPLIITQKQIINVCKLLIKSIERCYS
ncbi:MAG: aspartate aminotransferase family protein [Bacteroidia bacterium]|nr:aspartate aminotransferase family protein [Bacteroidia bacterium]